MSRSRLHKEKGKWKNTDIPITKRLMSFFDRYNFDYSEHKQKEIELKEKIFNREMENQIYEYNIETNTSRKGISAGVLPKEP